MKEPAALIHYSEDNKEVRCDADSGHLYTIQLTKNKKRVTCPDCKEYILNDDIDDKLDEAMKAYDKYMDLRDELIEMDEMAADRLSEWVDNHTG